jgi:UDP-N-acetylmuramyl tripeptide synthase
LSTPFLIDSRRLTGRTILLDAPGAVIETQPPPDKAVHLGARWRREARWLARALGWHEVVAETRWFEPTLHCALTAPLDQLMAATHVAEWAWELALHGVTDHIAPRRSRILARMQRRVESAAQPALVAFHRAALKRRAQLLIGDGDLSVGEGAQAAVYAFAETPDPDSIDWPSKRHRIPVALVTGTNGKTTTTRLLARMAKAAGFTAGHCCTDAVEVGDEVLDRDDYSGPGGARRVLRHPACDFAVLEVARGGMLRRGLTVRTADVAIVTNIGDDHLNDMGIYNKRQLAQVKFLVASALRPGGVLVTNADNEYCREQARRLMKPTAWFSLAAPTRSLLRGVATRGGAYVDGDGVMTYQLGARTLRVLPTAELGMPGGGAARHNVANALAAMAAAIHLKLPLKAIRSTLRSFGQDRNDNRGRSNLYALRNGACVLADFGHNPESLAAVFATARALPHRRLLISIGQAGDRDDAAITALGRMAGEAQPDRLIVKDMPKYRRGRPEGNIPALLAAGARSAGLDAQRLQYVVGDLDAWHAARQWLEPGDLAVLFVHSENEAVFADIESHM